MNLISRSSRNVVMVLGVLGLAVTLTAQADGDQGPGGWGNPGPYRWKNVQIVGGGFITGIEFSTTEAGLAYVRTDIGGSYRWSAARSRWVSLNDDTSPENWNQLGVESIALDPTNPDVIYEAVGEYTESWAPNGAMLRSFDRGRHWHKTDMPIQMGSNEEDRYSGERLVVDPYAPNVLYFGSRENGLWVSRDQARTWSQVATFPVTGPVPNSEGLSDGVIFIKFAPPLQGTKQPLIIAGVSAQSGNLYLSSDNGASWQAVLGAPTGVTPTNAALSSDGNLYVTYSYLPGPNSVGSGLGAVYKYNLAAGTWTNVTPAGAYDDTGPLWYGFANVVVDPEHPETVMVTTMDDWWPGDNLYRSVDGGATWKSLASVPGYPVNSPNYYQQDWSLSPWITFGGSSPSFGWWMGALAVDPYDSNHVMYGTGATIWATDDMTSIDSGNIVHFAIGANGIEETAVNALLSPPAGPAHLLSGVGDIGGFTHTDLDASPSQGMWTNPVFGAGMSLDYSGSNPLLIARVGNSSAQTGAYSIDGGLTWIPFPSEPAQNGPGRIAVLADGQTFLWSPTGGTVSYSRDFGNSWAAATGAPAGAAVVADKVDPKRAYAFGAGTGVVYVSQDGGATFAAGAAGLPTNGSLMALYDQAGDLWLATSSGLFHSVNGGITFVRMPAVLSAIAIGAGAPPPGRRYPALYLIGDLKPGVQAIFRSDDGGYGWVQINDERHQFGTQQEVTGDPRMFGRVYLGTNGRGVLYGDPSW